MNPSILDTGEPMSWLGDPHERTKKRYFGGVPIEDPDDPEDPGDPTDELVKIVVPKAA